MFYCWTCKHDKPDADRAPSKARLAICTECAAKPSPVFKPQTLKRSHQTSSNYTKGRVGKYFSENFD